MHRLGRNPCPSLIHDTKVSLNVHAKQTSLQKDICKRKTRAESLVDGKALSLDRRSRELNKMRPRQKV